MVQVKPIASSSILLSGMFALVKACGTASYPAEAVQEAKWMQQLQAKDMRMQYFTLQQPEEEAE